MSRYQSDNVNSFNSNSLNVSGNLNVTVAHERSEILMWLSPLESQLRHQEIGNNRIDNVGKWLFETEQFRSWRDCDGDTEANNATLFCHGDPGVGKTYINSLVIDTLGTAAGEDMVVVGFYFDFATQKDQSPTSVVGALLKQVVRGLKEIPDEIVREYEKRKKIIGGPGLRLPEIVTLLAAISSSQRTFICIDALDECAEVHRVKILDSLNEILTKSPKTRIFLTGRPHVRVEVEKRLAGRTAVLPICLDRDDFIVYIRTKLDEDTTPDAMDDRLAEEIVEKIPESNSPIFLLLSINTEAILREPTLHLRRKKLAAVASGLGIEDTYSATLERIKAQGEGKSRLGMAALMWICHSQRPLKIDELRHALAVEVGSTDFNIDNAPSTTTLLICCQGLVVVDKKASTVRLIHYTLKEYLCTRPDITTGAHSAIAETCLSYLNCRQVTDLSDNDPAYLTSMPFLRYSSGHWGAHAKMQLSSRAKSLALKLFRDYDYHISLELFTEELMQRVELWSWIYGDSLKDITGLHCASFFGITELVTSLIEVDGWDVNQEDSQGATPIMWATWGGQEQLVKWLLDLNKVDVNMADIGGNTLLSWAAIVGHEGVVKLLLERNDINPDKADNEGGTPLSWAVMEGHEGVLKMLLKRNDVNPDKADNEGRTPLSRAAENGHEGVLNMLLKRNDVNPDMADDEGTTSLLHAVENGHEEVVRLLLERNDVNPDQPDKMSRTPLWWAAKKGHEGVVELLLERNDINPDKADNEGGTPLSWAAMEGHEGVLTMLLKRNDINPDQPDIYGLTPLCWATQKGHEGVVKLLLERNHVNPDKADNEGRTPLSRATENGHESVLKMLLKRNDVNPDMADNEGRTPLSRATENGHESVLNMLLKRNDVNPDMADQHGQTPLWWATGEGYEGIVRTLLERSDVSPDFSDIWGTTPLLRAAKNGHEEVVRLLLERNDVDPDATDRIGQTALSLALWHQHEDIVKLLVERKNIIRKSSDQKASIRRPSTESLGPPSQPFKRIRLS